MFFVVAPFCSCPVSLVSRIFFAVVPGCAKCFFLLRPVGRRDLSAGPEQKKNNTTPGVCFLAPAPAKVRGRRSPVGRRHGAREKKNTAKTFQKPMTRGTSKKGPQKQKNTPWPDDGDDGDLR